MVPSMFHTSRSMLRSLRRLWSTALRVISPTLSVKRAAPNKVAEGAWMAYR